MRELVLYDIYVNDMPVWVLTVRQPWARLLVEGVKDVENRSYRTHLAGRLWIHAGKKIDEEAPPHMIKADDVRGAIIGSVVVTRCVTDSTSPWAIRGQWHWCLDPGQSTILGTPIPWRGSIAPFVAPPELAHQLGVRP